VLLRKGGIKEKGFKLAARRFALYPSAFHNAEALLQARAARYAATPGATPGEDATLRVVAECTGAWTTDDPRVLAALAEFHPWAEGLLETRFKWRPSMPVTVLELRASALRAPHALPGAPEHGGCTSWFALPPTPPGARVAVPPGGAAPALSEEAFAARQRQLRAALATLDNVQPLPLPEDA
jgi:hypothetical protein